MKQIFLILFMGTWTILNAQQNIVKTSNGKIQGFSNKENTVSIFKGIPFAAPPIGDLRWKEPQPTENWKGMLDCTEFSASPIQNKPEPFMCWTKEFIAQPEPLSEDCLYLNVWTSSMSKKKKMPVIVWIYGGGLSSGSANCDIYDGEEMAKKDVVFVSVNYRVGVMGFMAHPELTKESGYNASGNYGFLDQIAALKWVQKNISSFGGDPNNVTIAGQSAGAFSVTALIASPLAKGLFAKAIPQSGGLLSDRLTDDLESAEKKGILFMEKAGVQSILSLRKMSAEDLQTLSNDRALGRFGVTLDNYLLPLNMKEHFSKGLQNQVPILTGWVAGDGELAGIREATADKLKTEVQQQYGADADQFFAIFPVNNDEDALAVKKKVAMLNFAGIPSHLLAKYNSQPTYIYEFIHVPPAKENFPDFGAFHTSEVPYALHTLHKWERNWEQMDKNLENIMASYWVNFAKTGNPNAENLPMWKKYDVDKGFIMELGDEVQLKEGLFKKEFDFLSKAK